MGWPATTRDSGEEGEFILFVWFADRINEKNKTNQRN